MQRQIGIDHIRADLAARIAAIDRMAERESAGALAGALDDVRRIAQSHGLLPAVTVAQMLGSALAEGERGALIHGWLSILHDAIGCDRFDLPACDAYAAACSVRLAH
ncbi:hypothetical protein ACFO8O_08650 [Hephaestia sp. GCM10023244]|uniref:hypothetical protein n=1 Tax=unclassified Hephaestia TaxID=2631281 RepID=UPI002076EF16|nr:hypothetical protein [Hephaestia sp. MAHUQ-44]MCM8731026.1 hypothetical protein [Hephaestia sp. MAHUQ-44]